MPDTKIGITGMANYYSFAFNTPYASASPPGATWATLCAAAGRGTLDNSPQEEIGFDNVGSDSGKWHTLGRGLIMFDTETIGTQSVILSGQLKLYGDGKGDDCGALDINIYSTTSTSDETVVAADYSLISDIPLCDTPISYADWNITGYNTFNLNAAGLAAINKGGTTKIGIRNANYDVAGVPPTWVEGSGSVITWISGMGSTSGNPILTLTVKTTGKSLGTSYYQKSKGLQKKDVVTLEAIRNLEMTAMSRFYVDREGNACFESRYARNT